MEPFAPQIGFWTIMNIFSIVYLNADEVERWTGRVNDSSNDDDDDFC